MVFPLLLYCCCCSGVSNSLQLCGLQHARVPCPSRFPRICSNSSLSGGSHPTISSSVIPFSSCPCFFPASGSFPMSQLFASDGQSKGASVLPMNIQDWFPAGLTSLISLQFKGLSKVFFSTTVLKHQFFGFQLFLWSKFHIHTWLLKKHSFDYIDLCWQVMSLLFHMLFVIALHLWQLLLRGSSYTSQPLNIRFLRFASGSFSLFWKILFFHFSFLFYLLFSLFCQVIWNVLKT